MTICREQVISKRHENGGVAHTLKCRSWNCSTCAPQRKKQLQATAANGTPCTFITLTIRAGSKASPIEELAALSRAWRLIVKRAKRKFGLKDFPYMAFVESTKKGHPHLHILSRVKWLPFKDLQAWASEIIDSPIVNIQRIADTRHAVWYVTKYCGKAPAKFGTKKRYWMSQDYDIGSEEFDQKKNARPGRWEIMRCDLNALWTNLEQQGLQVWLVDSETLEWCDPFCRGGP